MNWKTLITVALVCLCRGADAKPGIRTPPATFLSESNSDDLAVVPSTTIQPPTNSAGEVPLVLNRRIFTSTNVHKNYEKLNSNNDNNNAESENFRMGVAVPLSPEDFEKEMNITQVQQFTDSSTQKEGISTWILLSGGGPTKEPQANRSSYRQDGKVDKIQKLDEKIQNRRTTAKPKDKTVPVTKGAKTTTTTTSTIAPVIESKVEKVLPARQKKPLAEGRLPSSVKKSNKKTTTTTTMSTFAIVEEVPTEVSTPSTSSTTPESSTFLILEPKDADFDLPQDRSPGPTTKKPKRNNNKNSKTKKNKTKNEVQKKPTKTGPPKDKPLSTKIYNYLAREIMPTVGVGLVGLVVTAGLATYFLGPFGTLRRSYDVADRKDDIYFYNNEEYAGMDGQSEEEVFGKVIAGMPANSPYRNNIKYTIYRGKQNPPHPQGHRPEGHRPVRYDPKYPPPPNRYRQSGPSFQGQPPHPVYNKPKTPDSPLPQHFYRYNTDGTAYRANVESISSSLHQPQDDDEKKLQTSPDSTFGLSVITPEPLPDNTALPDQIEDNNVLRRRSQFVVGSVEAVKPDPDQTNMGSLTIDAVPEHGPRRRRQITKLEALRNEFDDEDNEIEGVVPTKMEMKTTTTISSDISHVSEEDRTVSSIEWTTSTTSPNREQTMMDTKQTLFDVFRNIFTMKLRMGLSFLQNSTMVLQRYLKNVEKRMDQSKLFAKNN